MHPTRLRGPLGAIPGALLAALLSGCLLLQAPVHAAPEDASAAPARNASIPFAAHGGIRNWEADGTQGLWVQGINGSWYYGKFSYPCYGLQFKNALRFKFGPAGELDRWSEVLTREQGSCLFQSLVTSKGPPKPVRAAGAAAPGGTAPVATPPAPAPAHPGANPGP